MSDIINLTLSALIDKIKNKELSSQEITKAYIARAEKSKDLNTYITTDFENAIEKAKKFDEKGNFDYKLPGVPLAVKDLFCTNNLKTTAGSKILSNFEIILNFFDVRSVHKVRRLHLQHSVEQQE